MHLKWITVASACPCANFNLGSSMWMWMHSLSLSHGGSKQIHNEIEMESRCQWELNVRFLLFLPSFTLLPLEMKRERREKCTHKKLLRREEAKGAERNRGTLIYWSLGRIQKHSFHGNLLYNCTLKSLFLPLYHWICNIGPGQVHREKVCVCVRERVRWNIWQY